MLDKKDLLDDIKKLWNNSKIIEDFDISPQILEYLEIEDLEKLKYKILNSMKELNDEQKEWLSKFKKSIN